MSVNRPLDNETKDLELYISNAEITLWCWVFPEEGLISQLVRKLDIFMESEIQSRVHAHPMLSGLILRDFRFPPRCERDFRSSGALRGLEWWLFTDVSERPIGPICVCVCVCGRYDPMGCFETSVNNYRCTSPNIL